MRIKHLVPGRLKRFAVIGVLGLAPLAATLPAAAATPPTPHEPMGAYLLMIAPQGGSGAARMTTVTCAPNEGTHPDLATTCGQLSAVDGEVAAIPMGSGLCPMIWKPVEVTAVGLWNGEPRYYVRTFSNQCVAARATGGVIFRF